MLLFRKERNILISILYITADHDNISSVMVKVLDFNLEVSKFKL